jgi:hypothetical protein
MYLRYPVEVEREKPRIKKKRRGGKKKKKKKKKGKNGLRQSWVVSRI